MSGDEGDSSSHGIRFLDDLQKLFAAERRDSNQHQVHAILAEQAGGQRPLDHAGKTAPLVRPLVDFRSGQRRIIVEEHHRIQAQLGGTRNGRE